jgi:hypothetical protein
MRKAGLQYQQLILQSVKSITFNVSIVPNQPTRKYTIRIAPTTITTTQQVKLHNAEAQDFKNNQIRLYHMTTLQLPHQMMLRRYMGVQLNESINGYDW